MSPTRVARLWQRCRHSRRGEREAIGSQRAVGPELEERALGVELEERAWVWSLGRRQLTGCGGNGNSWGGAGGGMLPAHVQLWGLAG
jgi:hypothetical protein